MPFKDFLTYLEQIDSPTNPEITKKVFLLDQQMKHTQDWQQKHACISQQNLLITKGLFGGDQTQEN